MKKTQIEKLSKEVFDLTPTDQVILKSFALNGPRNQSEITRFIINAENNKKYNRWSIRRKILGTKRTSGLISREYLFEKPARKRRWGKQEKTYYPTVKGTLTLLSFGFKFEKTYPFNIFFDFISRQSNNTKINDIAKKYIINQIKFYLAWHAIQGFQLNKLAASNAYYRIFVKEHWKETVSALPFDGLNRERFYDMVKITSEYLFEKDRFTKLENEKQIPMIPVFDYYPTPNNEKFEGEPDYKYKISLAKLILNWYDYIESFQVTWYDKKYEYLEEKYYDGIPYSGSYKEFNDQVEEELHKLNSKKK